MTFIQKRQKVLRWWMSSVNDLTTEPSPAKVSALFQEPRTAWLWREAVLPPRLDSFQRGYLTGVLHSLGGEPPESLKVAPSARVSVMAEIEEQSRAAVPPSTADVELAMSEIVDAVLVNETEAHADLGRLLGLMWRAVNMPENVEPAVEVVHTLAQFILDMDPQTKITLSDNPDEKVVDCCGSGKRRALIPSISTAAAFVAAFLAGELGCELVIAKSNSAGTTTNNGSADALGHFGMPDSLTVEQNKELARRHRLSFWRCEHQVPNFASLYHGLTFAPTVLSLCAPAVLASPVRRTRIIYGLTGGSTDIPARVLARIYPRTEVLVVAGRDAQGRPWIDEPSPCGPTDWSFACDDHYQSGRWMPEDFGGGVFSMPPENKSAPLERLLKGQVSEEVKMMVIAQAALILTERMASPLPADLLRYARLTLSSPKFHSFLEEVRNTATGHRSPLGAFTLPAFTERAADLADTKRTPQPVA